MADNGKKYMLRAIELAEENVKLLNGGPFGAVIVKDNKIIGKGVNQVTTNNDPTAHAEIMAIRDACQSERSYHLPEAVIYTSCEPCPMCLGAIYWAGISKIFYANTKKDAAAHGFNDDFIYNEFNVPLESRSIPTIQIFDATAINSFKIWDKLEDKTEY